MSIAGIGTDLVAIHRIRQVLDRFPERFPRRVLTPAEYDTWCGRGRHEAWLAKRYAAKEALAKALGTGIGDLVAFHDLVLHADAMGAPVARLQGGAARLAESRGITAVHISLTDEEDSALAFAVLEAD